MCSVQALKQEKLKAIDSFSSDQKKKQNENEKKRRQKWSTEIKNKEAIKCLSFTHLSFIYKCWMENLFFKSLKIETALLTEEVR